MNRLFVDLSTHEATNATAMDFQITVLIGKDECKEKIKKIIDEMYR